jgi:predicted  nucleic acid-binding Zn-ribbon protein
MTDSQTNVVETVKEWIKIDNELKILQMEMKTRKERKKQLSDSLVEVLRDSDIDGWNTKEGKLEYVKTKTKTSLNKQHIKTALSKFIKNPEQVDAMTQFIYESRSIKEKESIKRKAVNS